jgi:hypothetical protein
MQRISKEEIEKIHSLRRVGLSILEISRKTGRGKATISRYIQGVQVSTEYVHVLREKQGGSRTRALNAWSVAQLKAKDLLSPPFSKRERLIALASLYWAEGTKRELGFINSDGMMIKMFIKYLADLGVQKEDLQISLRLFEDADRALAIQYWMKTLEVKTDHIRSINVLQGKKHGKLPFGMCRVRVKNNAPYFKILISMIQILGDKEK